MSNLYCWSWLAIEHLGGNTRFAASSTETATRPPARAFARRPHRSGTLPAERIVYQHGHARGNARIHFGGERLQRFLGNLIGRPADLVVILLRFLINDANAGTRRQVVK